MGREFYDDYPNPTRTCPVCKQQIANSAIASTWSMFKDWTAFAGLEQKGVCWGEWNNKGYYFLHFKAKVPLKGKLGYEKKKPTFKAEHRLVRIKELPEPLMKKIRDRKTYTVT